MTKGFLDNNARPALRGRARHAGVTQVTGNDAEKLRSGCEIEKVVCLGVARGVDLSQLSFKLPVQRLVVKLSRQVEESQSKTIPSGFVDFLVRKLIKRFAHFAAKLIVTHLIPRRSHDRKLGRQ